MLLEVDASFIILTSILFAGVGFTLLKYSKDGDASNRSKIRSLYADSTKTSDEEAWAQLSDLTNLQTAEVTWNVFMFIAIVSTLAFIGCSDIVVKTPSTLPLVSFALAVSVFSLQDLVHKWRNAHRRNPVVKEMNDIILRLRNVK
jgi:hypothetical protein